MPGRRRRPACSPSLQPGGSAFHPHLRRSWRRCRRGRRRGWSAQADAPRRRRRRRRGWRGRGRGRGWRHRLRRRWLLGRGRRGRRQRRRRRRWCRGGCRLSLPHIRRALKKGRPADAAVDHAGADGAGGGVHPGAVQEASGGPRCGRLREELEAHARRDDVAEHGAACRGRHARGQSAAAESDVCEAHIREPVVAGHRLLHKRGRRWQERRRRRQGRRRGWRRPRELRVLGALAANPLDASSHSSWCGWHVLLRHPWRQAVETRPAGRVPVHALAGRRPEPAQRQPSAAAACCCVLWSARLQEEQHDEHHAEARKHQVALLRSQLRALQASLHGGADRLLRATLLRLCGCTASRLFHLHALAGREQGRFLRRVRDILRPRTPTAGQRSCALEHGGVRAVETARALGLASARGFVAHRSSLRTSFKERRPCSVGL